MPDGVPTQGQVDRIERRLDKLGEDNAALRVDVGKLQTCTSGIQAQVTQVKQAVQLTRQDLRQHTLREESVAGEIRKDVAYVRGVVDERRRHEAQHPLVKLFHAILRIFGWKG